MIKRYNMWKNNLKMINRNDSNMWKNNLKIINRNDSKINIICGKIDYK
jgi:hypothetical protein